MGVVTWKNIAPSNPAGILSAANEAAKAMGEGFAGVGDASKEFAEYKTQRETDDFVADLMSLETQEERDSMIAQANDAWLNIDLINKTNYELGAPDREKKAFEEQLAASQLSEMQVLEQKLKDEKDLLKYKFEHGYYTGTPGGKSTKKTTYDPQDNSPWKVDGSVFPAHDTSWHGGGTGVGPEEKEHYQVATQNFLSAAYDSGLIGSVDSGKGDGTTRREITAWHINELANKGLLTFEDNISLPGWTGLDDTFIFKYAGDTYEFGKKMNQETSDALYEVIMSEVLGKTTQTVANKTLYWKDFLANNPDLDNPEAFDKALGIFQQKYNENITNKKSYTKARSDVVFGLHTFKDDTDNNTSKEQDKPALVWDSKAEKWVDGPEEYVRGEDDKTKIFDFESDSSRTNVIANSISGMDSTAMQTLFDTLIAKQNKGGFMNKDDLELIKQLDTALSAYKLSSQ